MISTVLMGVTVYLRLKQRTVFLNEVVMLISRFNMEIGYINLPLFEILKKTAESQCCKNLDFVYSCLSDWENGEDFNQSWKNAVSQTSLPVKKEEREKLISMGSMLGTSDADGQRAMLALYKQYFSLFEQKACQECEKYGKMSVTVSVIVGLGFFIMML